MHMSTGDRLTSVVIPSLAGIIGMDAGAGLVMTLGTFQNRPRVDASMEGARNGDQHSDAPAFKELQRRLRRLEAGAAMQVERPQSTGVGAVESEDEAPPPARLTMEQSRERSQRIAREHSSRFALETLDSTWAHKAALSLQADFHALAPQLGNTSATVECRTSLCKATLRWPSYREADDSLMKILTGRYERNCAITVTLPPPDNAEASYEGNVFFDCTEDRLDM